LSPVVLAVWTFGPTMVLNLQARGESSMFVLVVALCFFIQVPRTAPCGASQERWPSCRPRPSSSPPLRRIAGFLPLTHVTRAIRQPWLGIGHGSWDQAIVAGVAMVSALGWRRAVRL
jgi:hypothetical protein